MSPVPANAEPSSCPVVPPRHDLNTLPHHTAATTSFTQQLNTQQYNYEFCGSGSVGIVASKSASLNHIDYIYHFS